MNKAEQKEVVTFRLEPDKRKELLRIASQEGTTKSHILRRFADEFLEDEELREEIIRPVRGSEVPDGYAPEGK